MIADLSRRLTAAEYLALDDDWQALYLGELPIEEAESLLQALREHEARQPSAEERLEELLREWFRIDLDPNPGF